MRMAWKNPAFGSKIAIFRHVLQTVDNQQDVSRENIFAYFPSCCKGLTGLQRGPRCIVTAAPLSTNGVPVATPGGPYGSASGIFRSENAVEMLK